MPTSSGRSFPHSGRPCVIFCFLQARTFLISVMLLAFFPCSMQLTFKVTVLFPIHILLVQVTFCFSASWRATVHVCIVEVTWHNYWEWWRMEGLLMHVPCSSTSISREDSVFTRFSVLDRDSSLLLYTDTHNTEHNNTIIISYMVIPGHSNVFNCGMKLIHNNINFGIKFTNKV